MTEQLDFIFFIYGLSLILFVAISFVVYKRQREFGERMAKTAAVLRESEERLRAITSSAHDAIIMIDEVGCITFWNEAAQNQFGYTASEILGKNCHAILAPDKYSDAMEKAFSHFRQTGNGPVVGKQIELEALRKDGTQFHMELSLSSVQVNGVWSAVGIVRDLTERKCSESEIQSAKERFELIFRASPDAALINRFDDGVIVDVSEGFMSLTGFSYDELIGTTCLALNIWWHVSEREKFIDVLRRNNGIAENHEVNLRRKDGSAMTGIISARMIELHGRPHIISVTRDITQRKHLHDVLQESEERHRQLFTHMNEGCVVHEMVYDDQNLPIDYIILDVNPNFETLVGITRDQAAGKRASQVYDQTPPPYLDIYSRVCATGQPEIFEACFEPLKRSFQVSVMSSKNGQFATMFTDVTERMKAEAESRLHSAAINAADDLIAILDNNGHIVFANDSFQKQTGYGADEITGRDLSVLGPEEADTSSVQGAWAAVWSGLGWSGEMNCVSKDGLSYTADVTITPLSDEKDHSEHMIVIARNVSERKEYEDLLDYQAHHDVLTKLPNRMHFCDELAGVVSEHRRRQKQCAVLFIDLDKFKMVNDSMGHQAGDTVLVETSARLAACLKDGDILARIGGDEFTVLLKNIRSEDDAAAIAQRMLDQVSKPYEIGASRLMIGASIGISICPNNAANSDDLMKSADIAMYKAKELGRNNFQFFSDEISLANRARLEMESDLKMAMEREQLRVFYQPIVDIRTMQITGVEALLRWEHPEKGIISPSLFMPVAEDSGMIREMGKMVLDVATKQCKAWQQTFGEDFAISVAVSPFQVCDIGFISEVYEFMAGAGVRHQCLTLEVTESILAQNANDEVDVLGVLKAFGVKICLSGFGVGYSSLSKLRSLPIKHIKLNGFFTDNIDYSAKDRAVSEAMIVMAHHLGIQVSAECIEDPEQLATIKALECDYAQGYMFSPSLPADECTKFIEQWIETHRNSEAA